MSSAQISFSALFPGIAYTEVQDFPDYNNRADRQYASAVSGCYAAEPWSRSIWGKFVDIACQIDFNIFAFRSGIEVVSDEIESKILRVDARIVKA
jgi:hypothetical protein